MDRAPEAKNIAPPVRAQRRVVRDGVVRAEAAAVVARASIDKVGKVGQVLVGARRLERRLGACEVARRVDDATRGAERMGRHRGDAPTHLNMRYERVPLIQFLMQFRENIACVVFF